MAQQEKTCHLSLVPGPYVGKEENGFSKSCPLTNVMYTPQHTLPPVDRPSEQRKTILYMP